jgi:hypothetical protein
LVSELVMSGLLQVVRKVGLAGRRQLPAGRKGKAPGHGGDRVDKVNGTGGEVSCRRRRVRRRELRVRW